MNDEAQIVGVEVFCGTQAECFEFGLVLDAIGVTYERAALRTEWVLVVEPAFADIAREELDRYRLERIDRREVAAAHVPFAGSGVGATGYALVLILTAYCAGSQSFGIDWLAAGDLQSVVAAAGDWWRPVTSLTLHLDQEHLLGNLMFGVGIGILCGRMFGPGVAWLGILMSGVFANAVDMLISPVGHKAVGASTAVFAALGMLAGFGWGQRLNGRERRRYRWGPLFAGVCLLALLGAGNERVDVLGHLLGFTAGISLGWMFARAHIPRTRAPGIQFACGMIALSVLAAAWVSALRRA